MIEELKPCPKCGPDGAPLRRIGEMDEYMVECVECYTVKTPWFKTLKEAEAYWNAFAEGMKQQAARIAELEAERDRLRKALKEIAKFADSEYEKRIPAPSCVEFSTIKRYAEKALKGAGDVEKDS